MEPTYRVTIAGADDATIKVVDGLSHEDARKVYSGWVEGISSRIYHRASSVTIVQEGQDIVEDAGHVVKQATVWGVHPSDPV
jgi:hypothetical protein